MSAAAPSSASAAKAVDELAATFGARLLRPGDGDYDPVRRVHNGLVDRRPRLIARCRGVADIVDAIRFARGQGIDVAIRGGGHNVAGRATVDDGLMIDLSLMKGIHIDPGARTARAQGGVTWAELNRETQLHGLAVTGGVISSTGIAGLTLGGGLGWLMSKHGLALDNLASVELVKADGQIVSVGAGRDPDLFWALRGGGGNFGVAASLEYRLHPIGPSVLGGLLAHPVANARHVLRFYRDAVAALPDEMTVLAGLLCPPDGSGTKLAAIVPCHFGSPSEAAAALAPIRAFGPPVLDAIGPMSYCQLNAMLDAAYPRGALNYWKANFLTALSDAAIDTMVACFATAPSPMCQILLEHFHGAVTRVGVGETAFPHRQQGFNLIVLGQWAEPADNARGIAWVKESFQAMQPFMSTGRYANYVEHDAAGDPAAAAYGPNYSRLRQLKAKHDPDNFFHENLNIRPQA
jgi:FAD/FMN-containing dehydrogenase